MNGSASHPSSTPNEPWDILISYRSVNEAAAEDLAERLKRETHPDGRALRVWLDKYEIAPGQSTVAGINEGLEKSRHVGLLLTPAYFDSASGWTDAEWHASLYEDPDGRTSRVIPILIENYPRLPALLRHLNIVDLRGKDSTREYRRLVDLLTGRFPARRRADGQTVEPNGRLSATTLASERSMSGGEPDEVSENLLSNLLPVSQLPQGVWVAPLSPDLLSRTGRVPAKVAVKEFIARYRAQEGLRPFSPAFRLHGERIVTFHRLRDEKSPLACVVEPSTAERISFDKWAEDENQRRIVTSLLNMSVERHLFRLGLTVERGKQRFFFTPADESRERTIKWRQRGRPRTVAKQLLDGSGQVTKWRHAAARLPIALIGGRWVLQIRPTVLFTRDGSPSTLLRGSIVGPLATKWLSRERNIHLLYHMHFWAHILGKGVTPIRIQAGEQRLVISTMPLGVEVDRGLAHDKVNLEAELDEIEDPDEGLDIEEGEEEGEDDGSDERQI